MMTKCTVVLGWTVFTSCMSESACTSYRLGTRLCPHVIDGAAFIICLHAAATLEGRVWSQGYIRICRQGIYLAFIRTTGSDSDCLFCNPIGLHS